MKISRHALENCTLLIVFAVLAAFLMQYSWRDMPASVEVGKISHRDIRADDDYEIVDLEETKKLEEAARAGILPVFDWDESQIKGEKIIADRAALAAGQEKGILIRRPATPGAPEIVYKDFATILNLEEARARLKVGPAAEAIKPNLSLNEAETKARRDQAAAAVTPVLIRLRRGESIIRAGDDFEPWHLKVIGGILQQKARTNLWPRYGGTILFVLLFVGVLYGLSSRQVRRFRLSRKDIVFNGVLLLTVLFTARLLIFLFASLRPLMPVAIPMSAFYGLIPVAAGAMIVRLLLPVEIAYLFAVVAASLTGILENSLLFTLLYLAGGIAGAAFAAHVRSRADLFKAGAWTGLISMGVMLSLDLLNITTLSSFLSRQDLVFRFLFAGLGGISSAVFVVVLIPLFENLFNYLTPTKLLEFGSLNHPLLREMIVKAPGTYHHSHMVGTLAESACEAIGADSLFARVASYFHDIGKMRKPPYFIENQPAGEDRHASLAPSMSALIISAHVKDGMELGREHNLPQKILDIIPQHQGTKLISYFYSKAKQREVPQVDTIDQREFRYPGPKPQTREAGVILLADTVEAATRALKDRTPARVEEVVRNMINKNFIDGQLDECELTLKDLHTIAKSFVRILMGIYHQRIEYPEVPGEEKPTQAVSGADKYFEPTPITEESFREDEKVPPPGIPRIGSFRDRN